MKGDLGSIRLTDEELERLKELRRRDPIKAARLQKRFKKKYQKKLNKNLNNVQKISTPPISEIAVLKESDDDDAEFILENMEDSLNEFSEHQNIADDDISEFRDMYNRFAYREETRAAGKLGPGEEWYEETGDGNTEQRKKDLMDDDDEEDEDEPAAPKHGMSKKKMKQMRRPTVSYLKQICSRPEMVEAWDATAPDPLTLVCLKALRNTIPVPAHWSYKRRYLQGKRGLERSNFSLPHYIEATKITEIRSAIEEKDSKKTLKQRMREKSRPRHRKLNIDYQTLHDAFFKHATKPSFTKFGDMYFEGKETEMHFRRYTPGKLSEKCKEALAMTSALDAPPWLLNMQRYGPPPSYPNMVVPGVNAHIPEGAALGFQPGGWGRPPSLDQLKIWGVTPRFEEIVMGEDDIEGPDTAADMGLWGQLQRIESEEEEEEEEETAQDEDLEDGGATPAVIDPTGLSSLMLAGGLVSAGTGVETPMSVDLRRTGFLTDGAPKLYTVLEQTKAPAQVFKKVYTIFQPGALFMSDNIYTLPVERRENSVTNLGGAATPLDNH